MRRVNTVHAMHVLGVKKWRSFEGNGFKGRERDEEKHKGKSTPHVRSKKRKNPFRNMHTLPSVL